MRIAANLLIALSTCIASCAPASRGTTPAPDPVPSIIGGALALRVPFPEMVAAELLAADNAAASASARTDLVTGLTAMMSPTVIMPGPGPAFSDGVAAVRAALMRDTLNATSRAEWTAVRAGISADGAHGFTFGYMTTVRADGTRIPGKYLSYWVREGEAWRVIAYKRSRRPEGEVSMAPMQPVVPPKATAIETDTVTIERHRESLAQAERDFSRDAQSIGLERAFVKYGSPDAMNMGGPARGEFVIGNENIGRVVGAGSPTTSSPLSWAPDHRVIVASSGDLGVTFGFIRGNAAGGANAPDANAAEARIPFFTVWRRASPTAPWRYIAE